MTRHTRTLSTTSTSSSSSNSSTPSLSFSTLSSSSSLSILYTHPKTHRPTLSDEFIGRVWGRRMIDDLGPQGNGGRLFAAAADGEIGVEDGRKGKDAFGF
jgi:hypothetical protein